MSSDPAAALVRDAPLPPAREAGFCLWGEIPSYGKHEHGLVVSWVIGETFTHGPVRQNAEGRMQK